MTLPVPQMTVVSHCYQLAYMHSHTHTHTRTHTHTHITCSFLSINSTDQENPPPNVCDMGETKAGVQNCDTKTRPVQSNKRGTSRGRGGSWLARTRLAGEDAASASDDSGKLLLYSAHLPTHIHTCSLVPRPSLHHLLIIYCGSVHD